MGIVSFYTVVLPGSGRLRAPILTQFDSERIDPASVSATPLGSDFCKFLYRGSNGVSTPVVVNQSIDFVVASLENEDSGSIPFISNSIDNIEDQIDELYSLLSIQN